MTNKFIVLIGFILLQFTGLSKSGILDYTISVELKSTPVKLILFKIEEIGKVHFSYNPEIIDENRLVSLNIKNKSIRYGLSMIFDGTVRFKAVGEHIVLLNNEDKTLKENQLLVFSGKIIDEMTGLPIEGASIYDVDSRLAVVSNKNGNYTLNLEEIELVRSLYFSKKGYIRQVIVFDANKQNALVNNITLKPKPVDIEKLNRENISEMPTKIGDKAISGSLVSYETYQHVENLPEIKESRIAQISLVPSVSFGSNLSTNGLIANNFSLNVLAGYSKGVEGAEIGGLANIVNGNVTGAQIAGISNIVGGNITGFQASGIANLVEGNFMGCQIGGISSIIKRDFTGAQINGIGSITRGGFTGAQISGISNLVYESSKGVQISGIYNQVIDTLIGGQISGIGNSASKGYTFVQAAGIFNVSNTNYGLQASSIFNYSKVNNGLQVGLINTSTRAKGVSLGLINFVKEGYHKTEVFTDEVFHANIRLKSGVKRLYNSYNFGVRFEDTNIYAGGLGLGSYFDLSEKIMLSVDLSSQATVSNEKFNSLLNKFSLTLDYKIANWITVIAGPTLNTNIDFNSQESLNLVKNPIYQADLNNNQQLKMWVGGQFGLRF
jgi:hypothetical protein